MKFGTLLRWVVHCFLLCPGMTRKSRIEIAYRIRGNGGFRRKVFKAANADAVNAKAYAFVTALRETKGNDVEVRWGT